MGFNRKVTTMADQKNTKKATSAKTTSKVVKAMTEKQSARAVKKLLHSDWYKKIEQEDAEK